MKVAMVCSQVPPVYGGAGTQALGLGRELVRLGCEVDLLSSNQSEVARHENYEGVVIRRAPGEALCGRLPRRAGEVLRTAILMIWTAALMLRGGYDVHHIHGCYWWSLIPAAIGRLRRRVVVIKVTRLGDDDATTVCAKRWGPVALGRIYGLPFRLADVVVALNAEIARRHRIHFPGTLTVSLPNGVDTEVLAFSPEARQKSRAALGLSSTAFAVLYVGHLSDRKGLGDLLLAWSEFVASREGGEPTLLLVGPGQGFYREFSPDAKEKLAIGKENEGGQLPLKHLGHVPWEKMAALYSAADLFVLPTESEGMPNSLLEALAAGLPVLASRVPGVIELLDCHPDAPHLGVDDVTPGSLLDSLEKMTSGDDAVANANKRIAFVPREFTLDHVSRIYFELYTRLMLLVRGTGSADDLETYIESISMDWR
jgi:glycosyltransferase involved in cell wall biosynthesis